MNIKRMRLVRQKIMTDGYVIISKVPCKDRYYLILSNKETDVANEKNKRPTLKDITPVDNGSFVPLMWNGEYIYVATTHPIWWQISSDKSLETIDKIVDIIDDGAAMRLASSIIKLAGFDRVNEIRFEKEITKEKSTTGFFSSNFNKYSVDLDREGFIRSIDTGAYELKDLDNQIKTLKKEISLMPTVSSNILKLLTIMNNTESIYAQSALMLIINAAKAVLETGDIDKDELRNITEKVKAIRYGNLILTE